MLEERKATGIGPAGIDLAYQRTGPREGPPVLLIMGMGGQLIHWPDSFYMALAESGLDVIRFDNRDSGHSTHWTQGPVPNLPAVLSGDLSTVSYTLSDLAADAFGLMDWLEIAEAHVVGASMGGQIGQTMAIEHPERLRSLVSMMSTTGNRQVGQTAPEVMRELFSGSAAATREEMIQKMVRGAEFGASALYPNEEEEIRERSRRAYERGYSTAALTRQAVATVASGDRTERLKNVKVPTLVIHGLADRICDVSGGRATAAAIPGAELVEIEGMGHGIPPGLRDRLARIVAEFVWKVEGGAQ